MSLASITQQMIAGALSGALGQDVGYMSAPAGVFTDIRAYVSASSTEPTGTALRRSLQVVVSKSAVPSVHVGRDRLRHAPPEGSGQIPSTYTLHRILSEGPGHWVLEFVL